MDIAAMSVSMSTARVQQNVGISVAKKTMDAQEVQAAGLMKMMNAAVPQMPSDELGQIVDVRA